MRTSEQSGATPEISAAESRAPEKQDPRRKRMAAVIVLLLILILAGNAALTFALTPYRGSSREMWENFEKKDSLDTIYTGSSQCLCGVDPDTVDGILGTRSYNMGTNMQSFDSSLVAIKAAVREKGIRRVVLVVDDEISCLDRSDNFRADASFRRARSSTQSPAAAAGNAAQFLTESAVFGHTGSLNYFFPWTYDRSTDISLNIREKLSGEVLESTGHRLESGREPSEESLGTDVNFVAPEEAAEWSRENGSLEKPGLSADSEKELRRIASYCQENGIELIPVTLPYPNVFSIHDLDSYRDMGTELGELFGEYGYHYVNFNYFRREFLPDQTEYKDNGHLNSQGAEDFSALLARIMEMDSGETESFMDRENF